MKYLAAFFVILSSLFFTSCSFLYVPNNLNIPLHTEKKQTTINASTGVSGFNLQSSYSISDKNAIMVNAASVLERDDDILEGILYRYNFGEIGYGRYWHDKPKVVREIYWGAGLGRAEYGDYNSYGHESSFKSANLARIFFQGDLAYKGERFELGVALRFSQLHFWNYHRRNIGGEIPANPLFLEPTFFYRIGIPRAKLQIQWNYVGCMSHNEFEEYPAANGSIGLQVILGPLPDDKYTIFK